MPLNLLPVNLALERLLAAAPGPAPAADIAVIEALGRCLVGDVYASLDVPPADNSAMDGYAFRHSEVSEDQPIPVSQRIAAGHNPEPLQAGTVARIFTGAEIPAGADTVVMQENCEAGENDVVIRKLPQAGANVRSRAQDIAAGQRLFQAGHRLRAQDLGLLASQGLATLTIRQPLKVAVLSTGDELVEPGQATKQGQIYNSNRYTVTGLLRGWGFEVIDGGIVADRPDAVKSALQSAARVADVIISTGGVSVGEEDHVKSAVEELGSLELWRIAIKPGKPFAFGQVAGKPFLGLPGNPVSVFVTLLILGRPFLFACQGRQSEQQTTTKVTAAFARPGGSREEYLRVRLGVKGAEMFTNQSSGVLLSTSESDGLVRQRAGEDIATGDSVEFLSYLSLAW